MKHWLIRLMKFLLIDRKNFIGASAVFFETAGAFYFAQKKFIRYNKMAGRGACYDEFNAFVINFHIW